ncbi:MAG: hypothetical protein K2N48_07470, partial [Muribaculaceae bacterium]|nr:hypothetical protein [Muribaculaceae bacterium]
MLRHYVLKVVLYFVSVFTLCLSGCTDDLRNRSVFDSGAGSAVIGFSIENVALTREGENHDIESEIDHAYLLFYAADASLETGVPEAAVRADIDESDPGRLKFKMPLRLKPNTDYQLIAVANADYYAPAGFDRFSDYLDDWSSAASGVKDELHVWSADRITAGKIDCLPMKGQITSNSLFRFSMQDGVYNVSASLSFRRMVARIDLTNNVNNDFVVEGVALCNWRDKVSVPNVESELGNRLGNVNGKLSDEEADTGDDIFLKMPDPDEEGLQQLKESIYCFPSVSYDSYLSDSESTALIIKAKYKDDAESSYYRVNVGIDGNRSEVKANTKYLVNIQSVKGSGAPTVKDAYLARESLIVHSVVEDWDLENGCYAIDDKGNFVVLSSGKLEFEGDSEVGKEIKVLASKGLSLDVVYTADNEISKDAFIVSVISESPVSTLKIKPSGMNTGEDILSGKIAVSATTPEGGRLSVNLFVSQNPAIGGSEEPVIPDDMPFALIPVSYDRVKIDHENRTIEIDGFDPDCFNSFIDVPFKVYINDKIEGNLSSVNVSTTLQWPLEGRISIDHSSQYKYCKASFNVQGQVLDGGGNKVQYSTLWSSSITVKNEETINISVGAMGPDDPAIVREIKLSNEQNKYTLIIKPRPAIIDDVILIDNDGKSWLIQDRNIQDYTRYPNFIGLDKEGRKYQAYNYTGLIFSGQQNITIPFK